MERIDIEKQVWQLAEDQKGDTLHYFLEGMDEVDLRYQAMLIEKSLGIYDKIVRDTFPCYNSFAEYHADNWYNTHDRDIISMKREYQVAMSVIMENLEDQPCPMQCGGE